MGWVKGLEPSTLGTTIRCSNQLSYTHHIQLSTGVMRFRAEKRFGTPEGIRTPDLLLRRQLLYPPELLAHVVGEAATKGGADAQPLRGTNCR